MSALTFKNLPDNAQKALNYFYDAATIKNFKFGTPQKGNINYVLPFCHQQEKFILRLRFAENIFGYEKYIAKEVIAASLFKAKEEGATTAAEFKQILLKSLAQKQGKNLPFKASANIIFYRHASENKDIKNPLPPIAIHKFISNSKSLHDYISLHNKTDNLKIYAELGRVLAALHKISLPCFMRHLNDIKKSPYPSWKDYFKQNLQQEYKKCTALLTPKMRKKIKDIIENLGDFTPQPRLCHNDLHGDNILIKADGKIHLIDWDNWVSDAKERDFVVMKYWTCRNQKGILDHNKPLFEAYKKAYEATSNTPINTELLYLYEVIWLIRLLNYTKSRLNAGLGIATGFPDIDYYLNSLKTLTTK